MSACPTLEEAVKAIEDVETALWHIPGAIAELRESVEDAGLWHILGDFAELRGSVEHALGSARDAGRLLRKFRDLNGGAVTSPCDPRSTPKTTHSDEQASHKT